MAGVYDEDIAVALEMIQEFGTQVQWHKREVVLTDPVKPWLGGEDTDVTYQPFLCFVPEGSGDYGLKDFIPQSAVGRYKGFALMGQQPFIPEPTDRVLRKDGQVISVESVNELKPADDVVLYIFGIL